MTRLTILRTRRPYRLHPTDAGILFGAVISLILSLPIGGPLH